MLTMWATLGTATLGLARTHIHARRRMIIPNRPGALRFLARTRPGLIVLGLAAAATTAAVPASASAVASPVIGYSYVDGNTAPANTIDGFARHADGSLTPLAGSPFSAGARAWARASPP